MQLEYLFGVLRCLKKFKLFFNLTYFYFVGSKAPFHFLLLRYFHILKRQKITHMHYLDQRYLMSKSIGNIIICLSPSYYKSSLCPQFDI